jgi:long-chain acyl-CoA synthetase
MKQIFHIGDLYHSIETNFSNSKALNTYEPTGWISLSTSEFLREVRYLALALLAKGLKKGDKIGILALPCARWTIADLAIMAAGGVSVPLFANIAEENFQFEVHQTEMKTVFVGEAEQWIRFEQSRELFTHAISLDDKPGVTDVFKYDEMLALGKAEDEKNPEFFAQHLKSIRSSDIATIIYTSGSTGVPKGVVHTHHSIFSLLNCPIFNWDSQKDTYLSFLPLAHVFARVLNFIMLSWGISIYYFNDIKKIAAICQEVKPSVMVVVPRLLEKMYTKMAEKVESGSGIKKWIGMAAFRAAYEENPSFTQKLLRPIFEKLVYKKLREALGGRLRIVFSGGAALNPHLYRFYLNAGFPFFEGWGLTESCPITVNRVEKIVIGTVGPAIPGMRVKTSPEGELLVKGEMMMSEYYKNEPLTQAVFDSEGWLKTGDKGSIGEDGYVKILGRFKELLKTSTGEMIAPVPIEQALGKTPFIDTAVVIGDNRKFAACLLVPDFEVLKKMKEKAHMTHLTDEEFLKGPFIRNEMQSILEKINSRLNRWEQIQDYRFIPNPLQIEKGELTPSMKVKRESVMDNYKALVDSIYREERA